MSATVILVDLSSILHREFAIHQQDGDVNATAHNVVDKIRRIAAGQPHVAVCCDSGRSFRKDISPSYKAQRKERDPSLYHQQRIVVEKLTADGFPMWSAPGFEADDLLATATKLALEREDCEVLLVTSDKDLCQLVAPRVQIKRADTGIILDEDGVAAKFGVRPDQMRDWLCLVGDKSDNITGAKGIGDKTASKMLARFGSLRDLYEDFDRATATEKRALGFTPALVDSLTEFAGRLDEVRQLVTLRTDAPIPFDDVFAPRVSKAADEYDPEADYPADEDPMTENETTPGQRAAAIAQAPLALAPEVQSGQPEAADPSTVGSDQAAATATAAIETVKPAPVTAMVSRVVDAEPVEYERALDPRSMQDARILAKDLHQSAMFSGYGSPQAVLSTVMLGRELGLPAMASLRGIHNIEGKHGLSAQLMVALILKSGVCEYFERISSSATEATFEALRKGARAPQRVSYTLEQAKQAGLVKDKSAWMKDPESMCIARASSRLARIVAPDVVGGLYTPDELREARDTEAIAS
jgi:5'-3' exonuclease